ncbi:MAG: methyltransferase, partial [Actinomycetota bacterium]|nr:methyltransferase [Actinomycetota bacterium]
VDLCAGSGVIALSLALEAPGSTVFLVEQDEAALEWTERNVEEYRATAAAGGSSLEVVAADATEVASPGQPLGHLAGTVDVVCANPPYIPDAMVPREIEVRDHDPAVALYGGADGLDVVRGIARTAAVLLRPGGLLVIEHADTQGPDDPTGGVLQILRQTVIDEDMATHIPGLPGTSVFTGVTDRRDLAGLPRFTLAARAEF